MKIARNTPDMLVLRALPPSSAIGAVLLTPVLLGAGLLALVNGDVLGGVACLLIAAFPGYIVWRDAHVDDVRLIRAQETLLIRRLSLRGFDRVRHPLGDLSHAKTQDRLRGIRTEHRVVLVLDRGMDAGDHPLTVNHYFGQDSKKAADAVNSWLSHHVDSAAREA